MKNSSVIRHGLSIILLGASLVLCGCPTNQPGTSPNPNIFLPPDGAQFPNRDTQTPIKTVPKIPGPGNYEFYPSPYDGYVWMYDTETGKWMLVKKSRLNELGLLDDATATDIVAYVDQYTTTNALPPNFEVSAEDHLSNTGLSGSGPYNNVTGIVAGGDFDLVAMSGTLDVRFPLRSDMNLRLIPDYDLRHEIYCVPGKDSEDPSFWTVRVTGDAVEVAAFLADQGFTSVSLPFTVAEYLNGIFYVTVNEDREVILGEDVIFTLPELLPLP
ncbi:MAG: hypothetical protein K2W85_14900 [Phycisphaerales bacterium]|nr:hypothetical protein [Phycisphaerales bacterium]